MPEKRRRGRGEGNVTQLDDGRWCGRLSYVDGAGKRQRPVFYAKTKGELLEAMRAEQARAAGGVRPGRSALTVGDYLAQWIAGKRGTTARLTWQHYEEHVDRYLAPHLGRLRLSALTAQRVEAFYASLAAEGVSNAMARTAGVTLGVALAHAVHPLKLIAHNPAADVPKPRVEKAEMVCLSAWQAQRFLDALDGHRLRPLYVVWLASGCRGCELHALVWSDVDFAARTLSVTKSVEESRKAAAGEGRLRIKDTKTGKSRRKIVMPVFAMDCLAEHRKAMLAEGNCGPDRPVFCGRRGGHLHRSAAYCRAFRPAVDRANEALAGEGLPPLPAFRPYDLRHTCATLLLQAGESVKVVSERLGHTTATQTLNTYAHVLPGDQERAADRLEGLFGAGRPPLGHRTPDRPAGAEAAKAGGGKA